MILQQSQSLEQSQRIQVELERRLQGEFVKIRVEHYDEHLGWYTSSSLTLPLQQIPLLEQAVEEMRTHQYSEETLSEKIIPFPGLPGDDGSLS